MSLLVNSLIIVVAVLHALFLVLEMFLWQTSFGLKLFGMNAEKASQTAVLAKNQGLYNGFITAALLWTFFIADSAFQSEARLFILACVITAGIFGGLTAKKSILYTQALPGLLALIAVYLAKA